MIKKILLLVIICIHFFLLTQNIKNTRKNNKDISIEEYFNKNKYQFYANKNQLQFSKDKIKVIIVLYLPLFQVNKETYFFKYYPHQTKKGITLHERDYQLLTNIINFYQKKINDSQFSKKTKSKTKRKTPPPPSSSAKNIIESNPLKGFRESSTPIRDSITKDTSPAKKNISNLINEKTTKSPSENIINFDFNQNLQLNKIFLDAGHGGKDPGCTAYGYQEKDFTLLIAKELYTNLTSRDLPYQVILTRTKDVYYSLERRCHIANSQLKENENGIFISIHLNVWVTSKPRGFEAYFLEHDKEILQARTYSHIEDVSFALENKNLISNLNPFDILFSQLEVIQYQKESQIIANLITESMTSQVHGYPVNRGIKSDLFYVLKGTLMPSSLLEIGFLSNKKDLEFLSIQTNRIAVIDAIANGILDYVNLFNQTAGFRKEPKSNNHLH